SSRKHSSSSLLSSSIGGSCCVGWSPCWRNATWSRSKAGRSRGWSTRWPLRPSISVGPKKRSCWAAYPCRTASYRRREHHALPRPQGTDGGSRPGAPALVAELADRSGAAYRWAHGSVPGDLRGLLHLASQLG